MSYFFFNERTQHKNSLLVSILLYSGAVVFPLRMAFSYFGPQGSPFPVVLLAGYSLIAEVVVLLFFDKDDLLSILPSSGQIWLWIKKQVSRYYYPVFFFIMTILIIYNPYIGYFNLAWKLVLLVPLSVALFVVLVFVHEYLRKNLIQIFIVEGDDGAEDRFENAKLLYVFIALGIFFTFSFVGFFLLSRMWGFSYTLEQFWEAIAYKWVIPTQDGGVFGLVQVFQCSLIILAGFIGSSLINNFVLARLFDAFNAEPGLQNTVSRLTHYLIVFVFTVMSLSIVGLNSLVLPAFGAILVGIGLALKDQLSDIAGGIFILLERQFELGHFVEIASEKVRGTVVKISFRSTVIRTARNFFIAVPNRIMISRPVINWGLGRLPIGMEVNVVVGYESDPKKVRDAIKKVLEGHNEILKVPAPVIRCDEFQESGILFYVRGYFTGRKVREMWNICSDVRVALLEEFKKEGITIPYPHIVVKTVPNDVKTEGMTHYDDTGVAKDERPPNSD